MSIRTALTTAILATLISVSTPAFARGDEDGAVGSFLSAFADARSQFNVRKHAFCVAQKYPSDTRIALREDADMQDILKKYHNLLDFKCTTGAMFKDNTTSLSDAVFQPALAEAALVSQYSALSLPDVVHVILVRKDAIPEIDFSRFPDKLKQSLEVAKFFSDLDLMSECVARAGPNAVYALAETKPASDQEEAAFQDLNRPMKDCKIAELAVVPPNFFLRGALVKNLYLLVDAARPISSEKGKVGA